MNGTTEVELVVATVAMLSGVVVWLGIMFLKSLDAYWNEHPELLEGL